MNGYPNPADYEPILDAEAWQATRYVNPELPLKECVQLILTPETQE